MGRLTTHVLDTAAGRPAGGLAVEVYRHDGTAERLTAATTNADGRVDEPLLSGDAFPAGTYELRFDVGGYFRDTGVAAAFYDVVPVRFTVDDPGRHYHVPLLVSPFGYSTYRGS